MQSDIYLQAGHDNDDLFISEILHDFDLGLDPADLPHVKQIWIEQFTTYWNVAAYDSCGFLSGDTDFFRALGQQKFLECLIRDCPTRAMFKLTYF